MSVTGQKRPGKGKLNLRPSYIVLVVCFILYGAAWGYAAYRESNAYDASLPKLALNTMVGDLRAAYMKARPLRFPADLAELDKSIWGPRRKPGRPAPRFADNNHTYVVDNYKYVYHADAKNPAVCFVFAAPVGPRREEGGTVAVVVYPDATRIFKGAALPDKDVERLYSLGIPSASTLTTLGLVEQAQPANTPAR